MKHAHHYTLAGILLFLLYSPLMAQEIGGDIVSGFEERKGKAMATLARFPKPDTARVRALIDLISTALIQKQRLQLEPYCNEAMHISRNADYPEGLSKCYVWKGHLYKANRDNATAQLYYDSSINLATDSLKDGLLRCAAEAHRGKAWIYYEQENYYTALNHFFLSLKYFESRNRTAAMNLYTIISNTYSRLSDFPQAIVYALKNAEMAEQDTSKAMRMQAWLSVAEIYVRNNQLPLGSAYLDKIEPYMPHPVQSMLNAGYYMNRGLICYKQQQYDSSIFYYQQAYAVADASKHSMNKTSSLFYLSNSALKLGKLNLAKRYADANLLLAEQVKTKIAKINALLNLSDYYHAVSDNTKAYKYLTEATVLKDSLASETNITQINTLAAVYESDKKEKEIIQLQTEKEIQSASVKRKSILNKVFIASILALLFVGYLGFVNFKKSQQIASQEQALQKQKIIELEKDKQLVTIDAMLKGQEEERGRIAKELHDGIGSLLSGTKFSFIHVKENLSLSPANKMQFEKTLSMLDNAIGDLRKVAQNLMPEALVKFGLHEALRDFCDSMQSPGVKVIYLQLGERRKLDATAEIFIYRIIQELVNNAIKHAGASEVIAQLTMTATKTNITVEDNGRGFDKSNLTNGKGSGMANINYRVQYFNGTSDIVSTPGNGTSVNIQLIV